MQTETFSTIGHLIRTQSGNKKVIIGEVDDEVYILDNNKRHTLQRIKSSINEKEYFYMFQIYDMKKEYIGSTIPNIFPENILNMLLKKARENGWNI
jgi:hypothetical protein